MSNGGQSNTSGIDLASIVAQPYQQGDLIPQNIRDELERILIVRLSEDLISGNTNFYVRSKTEPTNKSVLWQEVDDIGNNVGSLKKYDFNAGEWVAVTDINSALQAIEESLAVQINDLESTISDQSNTISDLISRIEALEVSS